MTVAETSVLAYRHHEKTGKLSAQCQHILACLNPGRDYSRRELIAITDMELSSITGRVNELVGVGLLVELAPRKCRLTGRSITPVALP